MKKKYEALQLDLVEHTDVVLTSGDDEGWFPGGMPISLIDLEYERSAYEL